MVERYVEEQEESDEPTCGPGPFSMGDADVTSQILLGAGFEEISLRRCDLPIGSAATSTKRSSSRWRWARPAR